MNNKKYKLLFGALLIMVFTTFTSCDEVEDITIGGTNLEAMSGEWWVAGFFPEGESPAYGGDYVQFSTYNTASNDVGLWIDDFGNFFEIKTKVTVDLNSMTFVGIPDSEEVITGGTVTVSEGRISKGTFTTASNTKVDELFFKAEFDWDPGTVYEFKGHKRTGFAEDENPHYQ